MSNIATIIVAVIGSGALFSFIQFLIQRHDKKKDTTQKNIQEINKKLNKTEKDLVRLQLLYMIKMMPNDTHEIMTLAKYYFRDLESNWYMTPIFYKWMTEYKIAKPEWFRGEISHEISE